MTGELGGLNYRMTFPGQQQAASEAVQQAVNSSGYLPEQPKDTLANRRKLTADYYNNYALLKNVVKDAMDQGINPFQPDYSQEGGGLAFQAVQEAQAGLMYAANALKGEMEAETQMRPLLAQGSTRLNPNVDTQDLYASDPRNFIPTALDPIVIQANQELGDARYTQGDSNRLNRAVRDPRVQYFQQKMQEDPNNAAYYQRQIEGLLMNTPQTYAPNLNDNSGKKQPFEIDILKDTTNLVEGVWPVGTYNQVTKNGKVFLENRKRAGEFMGSYQFQDGSNAPKTVNKIIKRWLKDPVTGDVFIEYEDPGIPIEKVSGVRGDAVTSNLIANNPKYGSVSKMYEAARELGITDDSGSVINELLLPKNAKEIQDAVKNFGIGNAKILDKKKTNLKTQLENITDPVFGNNWVYYETPDGKTIEVAKHRGKKLFYIKNWEDLGYSEKVENLSVEDIFSVLGELNYFDKFINDADTPPEQSVANPGGKRIW